MALTATVIEISITSSSPDNFSITLNLKVNDGTKDVIDQDFVSRYSQDKDTLKVVEKRFIIDMQRVIDAYKNSNTISKSVSFGRSITNIQAGLTT